MIICIAVIITIILYISYIFLYNNVPTIDINEYVRPKNRIVISLSTIPGRVNYIEDIIRNLQKQTVKPDMIYVNIPYFSRRKNIYYPEPRLNSYDNVKIVRCNDYGPATKLLGCIPYEDDPDTMIITVDDDRIYLPNMVKKLVMYADRYPDSAVGYNALDKNLYPTVCVNNITDPYVHYLEGFGGVLYRRRFITNEMLKWYENISDECFLSDDLTISAWLIKQNIPRIRVCEDSQIQDEFLDTIDPLHKQSRKYVYDKCHEELGYL